MVDSKKESIDEQKKLPEETYAIGLYAGNSPFDLKPYEKATNPIMSRNEFPGRTTNFVADPFGIEVNGTWYLFFESMGIDTKIGKLSVSTSVDLCNWTVPKIVLDEPFHLSYPQVFKHNDSIYMLPETYQAAELRLYKAEEFPFKWKLEKTFLPIVCVDSTLHFDDDLVWLFACDTPHEHNRLRLFYAKSLYGSWTEHPQSPIYKNDNQKSRPAGKLFRHEGKLYRVAQNCKPYYGHSVNAFEITKMNISEYEEKEVSSNPVIKGGDQLWNTVSMHHLDLHEIKKNNWVAFVDGRRN